ncbi:MAG: hypothetical protein CXT73_07820 [Methanobacteriota archaeon]|jgi:hypothetical protein|nr:MAG: hypothetical protein CXT73_07820 [Euryarchaeota archaeon]
MEEMKEMKQMIINQCLEILSREDIKIQMKQMFIPVIQSLLDEMYPYIYLSILFVIICFILILGNFILLLRYKKLE